MTTPTTTPHLTPQFCFSPSALQGEFDPCYVIFHAYRGSILTCRFLSDFLRISRSSLDDTITANLNALVTPSSTPFDPSSTSRRTPPSLRHPIPSPTCAAFTENLLFPAWQARSDVLTYCASIADIPDESSSVEAAAPHPSTDSRLQRRPDNRGDPYAMRPAVRYGPKEMLKDKVENERRVERIVRGRTWDVVGSRCAALTGMDTWEQALEAWKAGSR